jgi:uncharacterized coiled-coil protein SlyX
VTPLGRLGRLRRDRRAQPEDLITFAVDSCECLVDGPFALLRLTGTGHKPPASLVADGEHPESFEPLPQPEDGATGGVWRTAFALPAELAEPGARLWLLDGGEFVTDVRVPSPPAAKVPAAKPEPAPALKPKPKPEPVRPVALEVEPQPDDADSTRLVDAWAEASRLRDIVGEREEQLAEALMELLEARKEVEPLRARLLTLTAELASLRDDHATTQAEPAESAEPVGLDELTQQPKSRRRGIGRRIEDRKAGKLQSELEARIAEQQTTIDEQQARIEQLEQEATSFSERRDEAVTASLQERIAELEQEVRLHASTGDDLRALLASERELVANARIEANELKGQLATAQSPVTAAATEPAAREDAPVRPAAEAPPWSALDDELLARIEKAKALTTS